MGLIFEWDTEKARVNKRKHRVSFEETATAFGDPLSVTVPDPDHSVRERRFILVGRALTGKIVVVAHTERQNRIRIISARRASRKEIRAYEEE